MDPYYHHVEFLFYFLKDNNWFSLRKRNLCETERKSAMQQSQRGNKPHVNSLTDLKHGLEDVWPPISQLCQSIGFFVKFLLSLALWIYFYNSFFILGRRFHKCYFDVKDQVGKIILIFCGNDLDDSYFLGLSLNCSWGCC